LNTDIIRSLSIRHAHGVYFECWGDIHEWVSHTKAKKKLYINILYVRRHLGFFIQSPKACWPRCFIFCLWENVKSYRIQCQLKMKKILQTYFWHLSNHSQHHRYLLKCMWVRDKIIHEWTYSDGGIWAFVVNHDLINSKNSTVIKQRTSIVNVACQL
jgi:hypothetical protein